MGVASFFTKLLGRNPQMPGLDGEFCPTQVIIPSRFSLIESNQLYLNYLFEQHADSPISVPQKLVLEIVQNNLKKKEHRLNAVPRLPSVIPKLIRSLRDPDSAIRDYVTIVKKDPAMSAAVLKLANSAYFNPIDQHIGDIDRAVMLLGVAGLRSVLSAAVMQPIIQRDSPYFSLTGQRMWQHSLHCAIACEQAAANRGLEPFSLYLLGLVHDVGKITLFSELCKQFKLNGNQEQPGLQAFAPLMRSFSAQLGYLIARDWDLPEEVCEALKEQIDLTPGSSISEEGVLLYQANMAAEAFVTLFPKAPEQALSILTDLHLPPDLYTTLATVDEEL
jgi:HD-like signal output (HDOD) protein